MKLEMTKKQIKMCNNVFNTELGTDNINYFTTKNVLIILDAFYKVSDCDLSDLFEGFIHFGGGSFCEDFMLHMVRAFEEDEYNYGDYFFKCLKEEILFNIS